MRFGGRNGYIDMVSPSILHSSMKLIVSLTAVIVLSGCAYGTHIVTGTQRAPVPPDRVKLYQIPPAQFEIIGIVNSKAPGRSQHRMDMVINELKSQAGKIGANGVLLSVGPSMNGGEGFAGVSSGGTVFAGGVGDTIQLSGQAIYVTSGGKQ